MKRILIEQLQRDLAVAFRRDLKTGRNGYVSPLVKLGELLNMVGLSAKQKDYVKKIQTEWAAIIILEPQNFDAKILEFDGIIAHNSMEKEKVGDKKFYELVVDAMRYDYIQSSIYPNYIGKLGIKACVYCNAQYAFAAKYEKDGFINYQLDHWKPKSKFPFLSTTFFNLQPCCAHCNQKKKDRDAEFNLFTDDENTLRPMSFSAAQYSIVAYMCCQQRDVLQIRFNSQDTKLKKNQEDLFQITTQYQAHKDIVEELLWKSKIYNSAIQEIYRYIFKDLKFKKSDFNRFIIGNYDTDEDIHKRPLSMMVRDIARQLHLI